MTSTTAAVYSGSDSEDSPSSVKLGGHQNDLSDSIFRAYIEINGCSSDLSKIQSFLLSSHSGALSCLICLEKIRPSDPTWSCFSGCFAVFHLLCIQNWARQSSDLAAARAVTRLPISSAKAAEEALWNCPKCRINYSNAQIPKNYYCFCGKLADPPSDPWILPHSCGEVCDRALKHNCGHYCLLLCHPGPCPSCPKLVKGSCFCGGEEDVRRCGFKNFSCNHVCSKLLDCQTHTCEEICHEGKCPPCRARGTYKCECGKVKEERDCCDRDFRCEIRCEKSLACGKHVCNRGCHREECGDCPLQGKRTCPCGNKLYEGLACDIPASLCGSTCDKLLSCGYHRCPERCHRGVCVETCRTIITKSCRCGSLKKEVPCYQDLTCNRKCQRMRDCGRHACKKRCCDGDCPPCSEHCDRRLRCGNHKCPAPCHRGACAPCPVMVSISCACGETHFEVPCGTEKDQKPPRCPTPCPVPPLCNHGSVIKPHRCHYGACAQCRLICGEAYPCGHKCQLRCHGPNPPPKPEFTLKPKKKKSNHQMEGTPGSVCPPCPELVWRSCVGEHFGEERMMICSNESEYACNNLCGNLLGCENHYCTKTCHALKRSNKDQQDRGEPCEKCFLSCEKKRQPPCTHPCPNTCHPGECPSCKVLIKRSCHCGSMVHVFECLYYNSRSEEEKINIRSCGGPCHSKLPNCTHLCPETCHPGECPLPEKCSKKVTVRCGCQTLKKEWLCHELQEAYLGSGREPKDIPKTQFGLGLLPCGPGCKSKVRVPDQELQQRKPRVLENKEPDAENNQPKRRKKRNQARETKQISKFQKYSAILGKLLLFGTLIVLFIVAAYYGYRSLFWISDRMNEAETQRQRRKYPRI